MTSSLEQVEVSSTKATTAATAQSPAATAQGDDSKTNARKPVKGSADSGKFKIVTVRMPDGTLKRVKRPLATIDKVASPMTTTDPKTIDTKPQTQSTAHQGSKIVASGQQKVKSDTGGPSTSPKDISKNNVHSKVGSAEATSQSQPAAVPKPVESEKTKDPEELTEPKKTTETGMASPAVEQRVGKQDALATQNAYYREKRRHQFKSTLLRGLAGTMQDSILDFPAFTSGDEAIDSDFSADDDDDNNDEDDDTSVSHHGHDESNTHTDDEKHGLSMPDGSHAGAALGYVAAAASGPPRPPPPVAGAGEKDEAKDDKKEKVTYKITNKDMAAMEEKIDQEIRNKPLKRHFADISFYLMASLSVVLPLLFLALTIFIACANGKSESSDWGKLRDAIKIAVSAWPIVYAAVVAQAFKTWATFRVERGIKLMELEQLVGSNSFASAVKQPFVLRRLNVLTLGLLIIWCLSPIGSQALQNIYSLQRGVLTEDIEVRYLMTYGHNRLFSPSPTTLSSDQQDQLLQAVAVGYISSLMPINTVQHGSVIGSHQTGTLQDSYNHPLFPGGGFYGIPLSLPTPNLWGYGVLPERPASDAALDASKPSYENVIFNMTGSYFDFTTCTPWKARKGSDVENLSFSISSTLGLGLNFSSSSSPASSNNTFYFASRTNVTLSDNPFNRSNYDLDNNTSEFPDWDFAYTECNFIQSFAKAQFICDADLQTGAWTYSCGVNQSAEIIKLSVDEVDKSWYTSLVDVSASWAASGNPYTEFSPTTPTERYAEERRLVDGTVYSPNATDFDPETDMGSFASNIAMLFNTWVGLGYCPECLPIDSYFTKIDSQPQEIQDLFVSTTGQHSYTNDIVFAIDFRWWGVLLSCCILLLLLGIGSVFVESMLVAPDVLGYVSTVARNSRYINLPKSTLNGAMSGSERARTLGRTKVMMQDVKAGAEVGKIALGMKHGKAERLKPGRLYR